MKITLVKKILADGSPCRKCADVVSRLEDGGHINRISEILIADERNPESEGMRLAAELNVDRAPFFIVEQSDGTKTVYTVYFKFVKEVLELQTNESDELKEILDQNPDLDLL
jgi:hypothetical protein